MTDKNLSERSMELAVQTLKLCDQIKGHDSLVNQLERSATSIGANIREANYAHSRADFIAKLQIALKECYETEYWLELLVRAELKPADEASPLLHDCGTIRRMLVASVNTAKSRLETNHGKKTRWRAVQNHRNREDSGGFSLFPRRLGRVVLTGSGGRTILFRRKPEEERIMRNRIAMLASALLLSLALCVGARAASAPESETFADFAFAERAGFTTEITDIYGRVSVFGGVLQPDSLERHGAVGRVASYAIRRGEEVVLSVRLHDVAAGERPLDLLGAVDGESAVNGFCSVELPVGGEYTAFLTGLTPAYVAELQEHALDAALEAYTFDLTDISFIDAEKVIDVRDEDGNRIDSDAELCWAASISNLLFYTGWAREAGFGSADYLFDELVAEFSDHAGNGYFGLNWFFNGWYAPQTAGGDWAIDESGYDSFAGYLPEYCADAFIQYYDLSEQPAARMETLLAGLREGCGVALSYGHYDSWVRDSGHAVTLWGMVCRRGADLSKKDSWAGLILSDSDNDKYNVAVNRRLAPNTLRLCWIEPISAAGCDSWRIDTEYWEEDGVLNAEILDGAILLRPYSADAERDDGGQSIVQYPDLVIDAITTVTRERDNYTTWFARDCPIDLWATIANRSKTDCGEAVGYRIRVAKQGGETVREDTGTLSDGIPAGAAGNTGTIELNNLNDLEPGVYEVSVSVWIEGEEAYLSNNARTSSFAVSSRRLSQDTLSFTASAAFDGLPGSGERVRDGIGRLDLTYKGSLGYEVAQYIVSATYTEEGAEQYQTLYRGSARPTSVYGLRPIGDSARVSLYATPKDPSDGYERFVGEAEVELAYFRVGIEAEERSRTATGGAETVFAAGDAIELRVAERACRQDAGRFLLGLYAVGDASTGWVPDWVYARYLEPEAFDAEGGASLTIDALPVSLPAGDYELQAAALYGEREDDFAYYAFADLGTLTVLPEEPQLTDVADEVLGATAAEIVCRVSAPAQSAFTVQLRWGTASDALDNVESVDYADCAGGEICEAFRIETQPETTYYYEAALLVDGEETVCWDMSGFTTPNAEPPVEPQKPEPPVCAPLPPDADALALDYGGTALLETFTPTADGVWRVTLAGPDGSVCVWDEESGWGAPVYFTLDGRTLDVPVRAGVPVRLRVFAYVGGDYRARYEPDATAYRADASRTRFCVVVGADETCLVAAYSAEGRLLSVRDAGGAGVRVVSVTGDFAEARVFRLDSATHAPRAACEAY